MHSVCSSVAYVIHPLTNGLQFCRGKQVIIAGHTDDYRACISTGNENCLMLSQFKILALIGPEFS